MNNKYREFCYLADLPLIINIHLRKIKRMKAEDIREGDYLVTKDSSEISKEHPTRGCGQVIEVSNTLVTFACNGGCKTRLVEDVVRVNPFDYRARYHWTFDKIEDKRTK